MTSAVGNRLCDRAEYQISHSSPPCQSRNRSLQTFEVPERRASVKQTKIEVGLKEREEIETYIIRIE